MRRKKEEYYQGTLLDSVHPQGPLGHFYCRMHRTLIKQLGEVCHGNHVI